MQDAAYKLLFSRPRMVHDLLDGFAARSWSGVLDFESLAPLPASFVGRELQQRHGDLIWRVRFRDDRWLYLVLLLEFQSRSLCRETARIPGGLVGRPAEPQATMGGLPSTQRH